MTYLGKKSEEEDQDSDTKNNNVVNLVKKDDILKQSIKTVGYEDTSVFFVQSGLIATSCF